MRLEVMFLIVRVLCYDLGCSRAPISRVGVRVRPVHAQPVNSIYCQELSFNEFCQGNEYEAAQRRPTKDASNTNRMQNQNKYARTYKQSLKVDNFLGSQIVRLVSESTI